MGANAVDADLFDRESLVKATEGSDMVLHLATAIPQKARTSPKDWVMNSRLRMEGAENLMWASSKNNIKHYIQQSVTFAYGHRNDPVDDTDVPTVPVPSKVKLSAEWQEILDNPVHMEELIANRARDLNLSFTVLRFGWFYSHDSTNMQDIRDGNFAHVWGENPYWSLIHVDDAVSSIHAVISNPSPAENQIFNVVDDLPVNSRTFVEHARSQFGKRAIRKVPGIMIRLIFGKYALNFLTSSLQVSNDRFKKIMGWHPTYPTYREGILQVAEKFDGA